MRRNRTRAATVARSARAIPRPSRRSTGRRGAAFGKCVSQKAKENKKAADKRDRELFKREHNAAKTCAQERSLIGKQAFAEKYGTMKSKRKNAFGKCVSQHAKS